MTQAIVLPAVEQLHLDTSKNPSSETLVTLLKENHKSHCLLWDMGQFPINIPPENASSGVHTVHTPHLLSSMFLLGATSSKMQEVYDNESVKLIKRPPVQDRITRENWRERLGQKNFKAASEYLDFFEREVDEHKGDWREVLNQFIFSGSEPLIKGNATHDLSHPLIHLAYAYEMQSGDIAVEALTLFAIHYETFSRRYLDMPTPALIDPAKTAKSPFEALSRVRSDSRFDGLTTRPGRERLEPLFNNYEAEILEHWHSWPISDPTEQFREALDVSVALLVATKKPGEPYDFLLLHILTACHAVRVILPEIPVEWHVRLFKQWWLFAIMIYITQLRPEIKDQTIAEYDLKGRNWQSVTKQAVDSAATLDAHYVKGTILRY